MSINESEHQQIVENLIKYILEKYDSLKKFEFENTASENLKPESKDSKLPDELFDI